MKALSLALLATLAPGAPGATPAVAPAHPLLPWLYNLDDVTAVDRGDRLVGLALAAEVDPSCEGNASPTLVLSADLAPSPGPETIVASYAHGVLVFGAEGQFLASAPGFACSGTADELEVLAAGTAFGTPTLVIAATTGGHREQQTWLGMFRVGHHGRLDAVFAGTVELREDGVVRQGRVTVLPDALHVRDPLGTSDYWVFDPAGGVYLPPGGYDVTRTPHG